MLCIERILCVGQERSEGRSNSIYSPSYLLEVILRASVLGFINVMVFFFLCTSIGVLLGNALDLDLALYVLREILGFRRRLPTAETFEVMRCNAIITAARGLSVL